VAQRPPLLQVEARAAGASRLRRIRRAKPILVSRSPMRRQTQILRKRGATNMAVVETRHLTKVFKEGQLGAVNDVNLLTNEGEFLVILGPSGSGKTTLLRMIAGLETPTSGDILIGGQVVNELSPRERRIAMVFQSYALYPHLSVYKNIAFPLKAQKV